MVSKTPLIDSASLSSLPYCQQCTDHKSTTVPMLAAPPAFTKISCCRLKICFPFSYLSPQLPFLHNLHAASGKISTAILNATKQVPGSDAQPLVAWPISICTADCVSHYTTPQYASGVLQIVHRIGSTACPEQRYYKLKLVLVNT